MMKAAWEEGPCKCCGASGHSKSSCTKRSEVCNICHTPGHLARVCWYKEDSRDQNRESRASSRQRRRGEERSSGRSLSRNRWRRDGRSPPEEGQGQRRSAQNKDLPEDEKWWCAGCHKWSLEKSRCKLCKHPRPKTEKEDNLAPQGRRTIQEIDKKYNKDSEELCSNEGSEDQSSDEEDGPEHYNLEGLECEVPEKRSKELKQALRIYDQMMAYKSSTRPALIEEQREVIKQLSANPHSLQVTKDKQKVLKEEVTEREKWAAKNAKFSEDIKKLEQKREANTKKAAEVLKAKREEQRLELE